jgi:stage V sporulation protein G
MKITSVKVTKFEKDNLRAFVSVTLDGCLILTGIKIMSGNNGVWVSMPQQKVKEEYKDIFFPITKEFRAELHSAILAEYNGNDTGTKTQEEDDDELPF